MCETDVNDDDVSETEITNKKTNKHLQMGASGKNYLTTVISLCLQGNSSNMCVMSTVGQEGQISGFVKM